ncbi:uncharacterized protein LOC120255818 [Dioscorea cayenensis subsp. rotundata]|uniref:Uncharacterized protein LOC120255818 n=1 Tax=Dioscorea cayennensis subsp. rotundata TaxID=55577 RepID=A0AB40AYB3_DIOCR|nr:uncharacterized protein LOC120255818 [Dioscorea cayenensis subsp. rotundata]
MDKLYWGLNISRLFPCSSSVVPGGRWNAAQRWRSGLHFSGGSWRPSLILPQLSINLHLDPQLGRLPLLPIQKLRGTAALLNLRPSKHLNRFAWNPNSGHKKNEIIFPFLPFPLRNWGSTSALLPTARIRSRKAMYSYKTYIYQIHKRLL